jgi:PQQ-dependent dehydrogenase (methanol/ethanol family)
MKQQRLSILTLGSKAAEALSTRPPKGATFVGLVGAAAAATMGLSGIAVAQTGQGLEQLMAKSSNWAAQAGDYANHRYSDLKQIDSSNVGQLQVAWTMSTGVLRGHEGSPLVIGETMYVHTPFPNNVYAVNLKDQSFKWKYEPKQNADVVPVMCCDTVNRGLAYGSGKILLQQADTTLVALDANTGKVLWTAKNGDPKIGETNTNAPHVFKDKVITGISGGEFGVRGRLIAYDLNSGKKVWTAWSTGPDAELLVDPQKTMTWTNGKLAPIGADSSIKTWKGDQWTRERAGEGVGDDRRRRRRRGRQCAGVAAGGGGQRGAEHRR